MTLLRKFGIPLDEPLEHYNLIGIDFGDGEITAAAASYDAVAGKMDPKRLALQDNGIHFKNVNAFYISEQNVALVYDVNETQGEEGRRYYNYKKCPLDKAADSAYLRDDRTTDKRTYRELMVTCFNQLVNLLFAHNRHLLSKEKPTILLVGRPSSPGWAAGELEYARMLQEGLRLPANQKPVYVAVQSESTAALAREIDPRWDTQRVQKGEIVVVLDNGSSTFDITVIASGGVVGESSYQFGGNQLDENLLKLMEKTVTEQNPGMALASAHGHKLGLRMVKEAYYGLKGTNRQSQLYDVDLYGKGGGKTVEFKLNTASMDVALNKMPVRVFRFGTDLAGQSCLKAPVNYASWMEACRKIYESFYQEMQSHFCKQGSDEAHPVVPDRIILSGGVSIMPEVQAAVKEAFGVEPRLTDQPNYSVSEGLAYVLGTEVQKKQHLQDLIAQLDEHLPKAAGLRTALGDAGEEEEWNSFRGAMKEWSECKTNCSAADFNDLWKNKYFVFGIKSFVQDGAERWYKNQKVEQALTELLKSHFADLFPDYVSQFRAELPELDFSRLPTVNPMITVNYNFFFGVDSITNQAELELPRDPVWRQRAFSHFKNAEKKIRKGGTLQFSHVVPVEKGLIFKRVVNETVTNKVEYPGLRSMYINDQQVTDEFARSTRQTILELLHEPLEQYVESITPYFNMTARQRNETET